MRRIIVTATALAALTGCATLSELPRPRPGVQALCHLPYEIPACLICISDKSGNGCVISPCEDDVPQCLDFDAFEEEGKGK